jgi:hypothetical protein
LSRCLRHSASGCRILRHGLFSDGPTPGSECATSRRVRRPICADRQRMNARSAAIVAPPTIVNQRCSAPARVKTIQIPITSNRAIRGYRVCLDAITAAVSALARISFLLTFCILSPLRFMEFGSTSALLH